MAREPSTADSKYVVPHPLDREAVLGVLKKHLAELRGHRAHPNRTLHFDDLLVGLLLGFFDPAVRSLRTLDDASVCQNYMQAHLTSGRLAKSTLSDALRSMDPQLLRPLLKRLAARVPNLRRRDEELFDLQRIIALDGSIFTVPADVLWAVGLTRSNGRPGRQVRLNLHLDVLEFVPLHLDFSGDDGISEAQSFLRGLRPDAIYLADRNFVDFKFMRGVLEVGSDFVIRLRERTIFTPLAAQPLDPEDIQAGVVSDRLGCVPGSRHAPGFGARQFREVILTDPRSGKPVRLLTSLLELPARTLSQLYRYRWMIELFFRWLKCVARMRHVISESHQGMTLQFYAAMIAVLVTYLATGSRPGLYEYNLLAGVFRGTTILERMPEVLARRARERQLERLRRARKKQG